MARKAIGTPLSSWKSLHRPIASLMITPRNLLPYQNQKKKRLPQSTMRSLS